MGRNKNMKWNKRNSNTILYQHMRVVIRTALFCFTATVNPELLDMSKMHLFSEVSSFQFALENAVWEQ
jgi:hypothetical protein